MERYPVGSSCIAGLYLWQRQEAALPEPLRGLARPLFGLAAFTLVNVVAARCVLSKIKQAMNMDPANNEYQSAYNSLMMRAGGYRTQAYGRGYRSNEDLLCQACQCYLCLDCCCDCI